MSVLGAFVLGWTVVMGRICFLLVKQILPPLPPRRFTYRQLAQILK